MPTTIKKRDGRIVPYNYSCIFNAIFLAAEKVCRDTNKARPIADSTARWVDSELDLCRCDAVTVEEIQDRIVTTLTEKGYADIAEEYRTYRAERTRVREAKSKLMQEMNELTFTASEHDTEQRENANIDSDCPMGTMLKYGSTVSKEWCLQNLVPKDIAEDHISGKIHIHDLDFYALTTTCTQISLKKLFEGGFFTGHGYLREPNSINSYAALACIAIQANQNDQHGGQSIPNFEYDLAPGVSKSFIKNVYRIMDCMFPEDMCNKVKGALTDRFREIGSILATAHDVIMQHVPESAATIFEKAVAYTRKDTYQAMEALIHNLNTMSSRAGAQVPFSSINYGTGTSEEQRMVITECLNALDAGLGNGETSIFPIHVFKVKRGVNFEKQDPNYDLFIRACEVSAKRLFPNFVFLDAPFNLEYYKPGDPDTEVATMGCRTRVMANVNGPSTTSGRGNNSFTTINLPRLAIEAKGEYSAFLSAVEDTAYEVVRQLLIRYKVQANRHVYNYPFLMGQHVAMGSDNLLPNDTVQEAIKHGTLTIGFIGLAEAMVAVFGKHHGEDKDVWEKAYETIATIRKIADKATAEHHLNFSVIATPAESTCGRLVRLDKEKYGIISGVTDREYYTNSFHVPVYYPCSVFHKIDVEAPFHALCNGGHITYVELDGDITKNVEAFVAIIRYMESKGIGYGSINHPIDRCPVCGYTGVIGDTCPRCGIHEGDTIGLDEMQTIFKKYNSSCRCH